MKQYRLIWINFWGFLVSGPTRPAVVGQAASTSVDGVVRNLRTMIFVWLW